MEDAESRDAQARREPQKAPTPPTPGHEFWSAYMKHVESGDQSMLESWREDMDGLLIFVRDLRPSAPAALSMQAGLYSAAMTAFLVESYKQLQPDTDDLMVTLLTQISLQLGNLANTSIPAPSPLSLRSQPFLPGRAAVAVNVLWFLSLVLSLSCALGATLVKQWARVYHHDIRRQRLPERRGQMHVFLRRGLDRWKVEVIVDGLPTLVHIALGFFLCGLVVFLSQINGCVFTAVAMLSGFARAAYCLFTAAPLLSCDSPYQTPWSGFTIRLVVCLITFACRIFPRSIQHNRIATLFGTIHDQLRQGLRHRRIASALPQTHKLDFVRGEVEYKVMHRHAGTLSWAMSGMTAQEERYALIKSVPRMLDAIPTRLWCSFTLRFLDGLRESKIYEVLSCFSPDVSRSHLEMVWSIVASISGPELQTKSGLPRDELVQRLMEMIIVLRRYLDQFPPGENGDVDTIIHCIRTLIRCVEKRHMKWTKFPGLQLVLEAVEGDWAEESVPQLLDRINTLEAFLRWSPLPYYLTDYRNAQRVGEAIRDMHLAAQSRHVDLRDMQAIAGKLVQSHLDRLPVDHPINDRWNLVVRHLEHIVRLGKPIATETTSIFGRTLAMLISGLGASSFSSCCASYERYREVEEATSQHAAECSYEARVRLSEMLCKILDNRDIFSDESLQEMFGTARWIDSTFPRLYEKATCTEQLVSRLEAFSQENKQLPWVRKAISDGHRWLYALSTYT